MMAVIFVDFGPHPAHDFGKTSRKGTGRGRCATAAQPHSTSRCGVWRSRRWRQTHADRAIAYPRSTIIGARSWAFSSTGRSPVRIASGAAAAQRYVLRSCEFHGFVPPPGPRRPKLCNRWLSVTRCRSRSAVGGFVSRYVGDGVIIYFGWPSAQEADAEQAVRAALAVIEAVGQSPVLGKSLQVHIGIATGLALVGELMGAASPQQHTAIGETLNLAARLQSLAGPDCAVIDAATRRRIGGLFECRDLGPVVLKGMPDPVSAWEVTRAMSGSRSEALYSAEDLPPLVGRKDELSILLRLWHQAKAGQGRVVLLSGEPGIGKSRLTVSLVQQLRGEQHTKLCFLGSPQHQDSPLFPIIARMEQGGEPPLSEVSESSSLRTPPPRAVSAEGKRERLLSALVKQLTDLAAQCPAIVVFKDVHLV